MKDMNRGVRGVAVLGGIWFLLAVFSSGCEWTSSGNEGSWNDSMSWVNFSGLYRAPSGRTLIGDFSQTGGGQLDPGNGEGGEAPQEFAISNQSGPVQPSPFTVMSGTIDYPNKGTPGWRLKPGSVRVDIRGTTTGPLGSFSDSGSDIREAVNGPLVGNYSQVPGGPNFPGSGSVNYDTGAWSVSLSSSDPFIQPAQITYSYVVIRDGGAGGGVLPGTGGGAGAGGASISIRGGRVNSVQVEQLGNKLTFRLSSGHVLSGQLSVVTLPGGDSTGRSGGDVSATYEVSGDIGGETVRISGTLSGVYVPPADIQFANPTVPIISGILSNRILQGIWMQSNGTADVYGAAPQQSVPVNVGDFQPIVEDVQPTTGTAVQQ